MIKAYFTEIKNILQEQICVSEKTIYVAVAWFTSRELFSSIIQALDRGIKVSIILVDDLINRNEYGLDFTLYIKR